MKTRFSLLLVLLAIVATGCESDPTAPPIDPGPYAKIETWAGTGVNGGTIPNGAPLRETELSIPLDVAFAPDGTPFIIDYNNHRLLRVENGGRTNVVCGTGELGFAPEGPAVQSGLNHPTNVTFDPQGRLVFAAWHNSKIMRLDLDTGELRRIAGVEPTNGTNSNRGFRGDGGAAVHAWLDLPVAVAFDSRGDMYIADQKNVRIRKVNAIRGEVTSTAVFDTNKDEQTGLDEDRPSTATVSTIETIVGNGSTLR